MKTLEELWDEAAHHPVDMGNRVFCDQCGHEWTGRPESGGFLIGTSKAICPECAPEQMAGLIMHHEEGLVTKRCPEGESFWKWCLDLRGGNNTITVLTGMDAVRRLREG
jgi:hypothetical protein